jgi:uncharacterized protein (TIGR02284 family)
MATPSSSTKDPSSLLVHLIHLDFDAIEAYDAAIARLEDRGDRDQFRLFMAEHREHVDALGAILRGLGGTPPTHGDLKRILTRGKVVLGGLVGDRAIMAAMKENEDDTNRAYLHAVSACGPGSPAGLAALIERNLNDERHHREYIEMRLGTPGTLDPIGIGPILRAAG